MNSLHNKKIMLNKKLVFKKSPSDPRNYKVTLAPHAKAANVVDNSAFCSPILDQGIYGSCTAFASVGAMEFLMKKTNTRSIKLSEKFAYYVARVNIEGVAVPPADDGAYLCDALKGLVKYGSCLSNTCPYVRCNDAPSIAAYSQAPSYQVTTYAQIDDMATRNALDVIKTTLSAGYPVIAGFTCYSSLYNAVKGVIPEPKLNEQVIGGHAVLIVGYNDITKQFKFKNSWGSSWGANGYGFLPYSYYLNGDMTDIWTIYNGLVGPTTYGLIVTSPQIVKNKMSDIFEQVMLNYSQLSSLSS